ncbi:ABC transporter substrate-binding protein [Bosea lathyri]|uniref:NitT/TauT family transport system substrate-binding protein n=1 Tax=Bosea lathyri TaxID=1036778 RepID=A0A1H6C6H8_9HYPH|nr:ABC transporter substrate-binding protein [Bosea lathyri]SEG68571.1 NitT/TauT family transport system substrate-binding protein [Bosea lathyri]
MRHFVQLVAVAGLALFATTASRAEVGEIRAAQQYGLSSLPLMIMEDGKLVEKHAKALGLGELKVSWIKLGNPGAITEGLVSGSLDFGSGGVPSLLTLWSRTQGTAMEVKGAGAIVNMPMELLTTNPKVSSIKDFTDQDRIAVTTVKVSNQALLLQMAAAKEFGTANFGRLDPLTVSLPHPEATSTLLSGSGVISAHFSALPFQHMQKRDQRVRKILSSYDVLGGPATNTAIYATKRFRDANPKAYQAFVGGLQEAIEQINKDKRAAAETYRRMTGTKEGADEIYAMIAAPEVEMTYTPHQTMKMASFMAETGRLKIAPKDWKDLFFDNVHSLPGS